MNQFEHIEEEMTDAGKADPEDWGSVRAVSEPKAVKGGVFAAADIKLIKDALSTYIQVNAEKMPDTEVHQIVSLLHRLNNRI